MAEVKLEGNGNEGNSQILELQHKYNVAGRPDTHAGRVCADADDKLNTVKRRNGGKGRLDPSDSFRCSA